MKTGTAGENLLALLELRIDNVMFRMDSVVLEQKLDRL